MWMGMVREYSKAVVVVAEAGGEAAAGAGAADLDLVAPGAAAGGAARAGGRAARVALRALGVVVGGVPVATPLVDVVAHVEQAEAVGARAADRVGAFLAHAGERRVRAP